jgi:hypothetical protein
MTGPHFRKEWTNIIGRIKSIDVVKQTHQWKTQGCREMKEAGIATDDICRFVGQLSKSAVETAALNASYLTDPPTNCIVQRAGGDPNNPKGHWPAWSRVPVPEELLRLDPKFALLLDQRDKIHVAFDACAHRKE